MACVKKEIWSFQFTKKMTHTTTVNQQRRSGIDMDMEIWIWGWICMWMWMWTSMLMLMLMFALKLTIIDIDIDMDLDVSSLVLPISPRPSKTAPSQPVSQDCSQAATPCCANSPRGVLCRYELALHRSHT